MQDPGYDFIDHGSNHFKLSEVKSVWVKYKVLIKFAILFKEFMFKTYHLQNEPALFYISNCGLYLFICQSYSLELGIGRVFDDIPQYLHNDFDILSEDFRLFDLGMHTCQGFSVHYISYGLARRLFLGNKRFLSFYLLWLLW